MGKVLCFGELLLRLSPAVSGEWIREQSMPVFVGGAELNAAQALAIWGTPVAYMSALPDNLLSKQIIQYLNQKQVDVSVMQYRGNRIGTYYLPVGSELKNAGVIYDRAHSSFSELEPGMIDWDKAFDGITWFHFSAICPALSQGVADVCEEALIAARAKGIFVSVDLNYRSKLWKYGMNSSEVMPRLAQYCNLIMGNVWAANTMLNVPVDHTLPQQHLKKAYLEQAMKTSLYLREQYPECSIVANTFRFDKGETGVDYYTTLFDGNQLYVSEEYTTEHVVDKVGSGDCFMAGLIYGYINKNSPQQTVDFATAAAYEKLFITGDATDRTVAQVHAANAANKK
ncbi:MAG: sugar kinase [Sphingobacteriales bacterium]|nr:MAG: sugar kinase [Sphingobacteriales bacterium]